MRIRIQLFTPKTMRSIRIRIQTRIRNPVKKVHNFRDSPEDRVITMYNTTMSWISEILLVSSANLSALALAFSVAED
jgi:hypothetical protein